MPKDTIIKIVAISSGKYPESNALSVRHLAILRGLIENGANARLLSIYAWGDSIDTYVCSNRILIQHLVTSNSEVKNILIKSLYNFMGVFLAIVKIINPEGNLIFPPWCHKTCAN